MTVVPHEDCLAQPLRVTVTSTHLNAELASAQEDHEATINSELEAIRAEVQVLMDQKAQRRASLEMAIEANTWLTDGVSPLEHALAAHPPRPRLTSRRTRRKKKKRE